MFMWIHSARLVKWSLRKGACSVDREQGDEVSTDGKGHGALEGNGQLCHKHAC